ncbi:DUF4367 domain-containing protein [Candidatus Aerophobetes bacterium]|nr:DUF4367 domain-containing protein [Candidatus Aerophobetes bacterium]
MNLVKYLIALFIFTFSFILTFATFTFPSRAEDSEHIMRSSFATTFQIDFEGIKEVYIYRPQTFRFVTRVIYQKPDFVYTEYLEPDQLKGKIIIDDGKRRIEYLSVEDRTRILPSFNHPQMETLREMALKVVLSNFKISFLSREEMLGREVYVFELSPKNTISPSLKLWIDKETYLTLQRETYGPGGEPVFFFRYIEVEFNKEFSREKLYEKIPQTAQIKKEPPLVSYFTEKEITEKLKFPVCFPTYLPPGYVFQAGELTEEKRDVKLIYTNGLEVIVLFQRPRVNIMMRHHRWVRTDKMRIRYVTGPYGSTLVWDGEDKTFVLMGDVPVEELIKVAQSVE